MDIPNIFTIILPSGLFCLLVIWLVAFAWLALRPTSDQQVEEGEQTTLPPIHQSSGTSFPTTTNSSNIHPMAYKQSRATMTTETRRNMALEHSGHY